MVDKSRGPLRPHRGGLYQVAIKPVAQAKACGDKKSLLEGNSVLREPVNPAIK
jgi:hypothetical protein